MTRTTPPLYLDAISDELDTEDHANEGGLADTLRNRMPRWWWITAGLVVGGLVGWFLIAPVLAPLFHHG